MAGGESMREIWWFITDHAVALTLVVTIIGGIIVGAVYVGNLSARVAQAEDAIKEMETQVQKVDSADEERVKRIYDKLDSVTTKLEAFTHEMRQHYMDDAEHSKVIAVNLQKLTSDIEAIRSRMERSLSRSK
jgi:hypothetical protein